MGEGDAGDVVVEADPGAAFEVVQAEAGFHLAVVVFSAPLPVHMNLRRSLALGTDLGRYSA